MSIPIPSGMARGKVTWRIGHDRAGTTLPGASGTVRFEPTARAVSYASATVLPEPVETPVVAGVMTPVDLQVNDPAVWSWRVIPMLGVEWPAFVLDVVAAGVDVARVAVVEASVPTRLVTAATLSEWRAALNAKVDGTDPRLTDARTPTAHQHAPGDVQGLTAALYKSGPRRLTTLQNGWTGDVRISRVGPWVQLVLNGVSGAAATSEIVFTLPAGFIPSVLGGTIRGTAHLANSSGATTIYRYYVAGNVVRITGGPGLAAALYSEPLTFLTDDPIPTTPPWSTA